MDNDSEATTALASLDLLETRLRRVNFYITGEDVLEGSSESEIVSRRGVSIQERLRLLEEALQRLSSSSVAVRDLLFLCNNHSDLFTSGTSADDPSTFSMDERLAIIKSCATLYPTVASRLTSVQDMPIPPTESSVALVSLLPRIAKIKELQDSQAAEVADLSLQSAAILKRWYEIGVLGSGECWTEWEERMLDMEKIVRRGESRRAQEAAVI